MKIQYRNGKVVLDGYVNSVERFSKVLQDKKGKFIERIMPNAFSKAIKRTSNIPVLLNHNDERVLANTKNGTAKIYEDSIGLRAIVEIEDAEVIEDAKAGNLRGWSFRFVSNSSEEVMNDDGIEERSIKDLDIYEVSIINSKKIPAYAGTSIELRNENKVLMEYRYTDEQVENIPANETLTSNQKREILQNKLRETFSSAWLEDLDEKFIYASNIDEDSSTFKISYSIENNVIKIDTSNLIKVMRSGYIEIERNEVPNQQSERTVDKIDYSSYEERLSKIKGGIKNER